MTAISTFRFHIELIDDLFIKGYNGRIVHGAFLQFIREFNEDLANYLHEQKHKRPYSLSEMDFEKIGEGWVAYFDLNTVDDMLIQNLIQLLVSDEKHEIFIIDRFCPLFKVEYQKTMIPDPSPLEVGTRIWINFESPTVFASDARKAKTDPYPHLDVIWKQIIGLYSRLIDDIDEQDQALLIHHLIQQLATPKFKFISRHMTIGHKIRVTGFQGSILFMIEDNSKLELLEPMLKVAEVWGIGGKTTMGFGQLSINIYPPKKKKTDRKNKSNDGKKKFETNQTEKSTHKIEQ